MGFPSRRKRRVSDLGGGQGRHVAAIEGGDGGVQVDQTVAGERALGRDMTVTLAEPRDDRRFPIVSGGKGGMAALAGEGPPGPAFGQEAADSKPGSRSNGSHGRRVFENFVGPPR